MICVYDANATDFSTLGLGTIHPSEAIVEEYAGGAYTLKLTHPVDAANKWTYLQTGNIIKAPAPVRDTPLIQIIGRQSTGSGGGTVTRTVYTVRVSVALRLRTGPGTSYRRIASYKNGTKVKSLETSGNWHRVVVLSDGATGWMSGTYLVASYTVQDTIDAAAATVETIDTTIESHQTRDQLFRIAKVERDSENAEVTVIANHIFYDLAGNIVGECNLENVAVQTAWNRIITGLSHEHPFNLYCAITEGTITADFSGWNIVKILLDADSGFVAQTGAYVLRDNFDVYIYPARERSRGVEIRHGKNLIGAVLTEDESNIITRIKPIGKTTDDGRLYLSDTEASRWVTSRHISDYPIYHDEEREYDVRMVTSDPDNETKFTDITAARAKLSELANADFAAGCDLPDASLDVDFVLLENTAEYTDYAALEKLDLYDSARIVAPTVGINMKMRMCHYKFDGLLNRYDGIEMGDITDNKNTVYGYQLSNGSVSGVKLIPQTITGAQIRNLSIDYAKMTLAAVTQLAANSITALTAKINALTAQTIETDLLSVAMAHAVQLIAGKVQAGEITTGTITAAMAELEVLVAGTASFDAATVRHLVSSALNVTNSTSGDAFIENLRVRYAQMVSATIGDLCIKATDGNYYLIDVNSNGTVTATQTTVTSSEIAQGHTNAGDVILATSITAGDLSTANIFATYALINQIDAARIDVDQLYARQAFIDRLNTTDIRSNSYLRIMVGEAERSASQWRVEITSTDGDRVLIGTGSTTLTAHLYYGARDMTATAAAGLFSWTRSSGDDAADATWNAAHSGMKSVTVSAGETGYNAVYSCCVNNDAMTAVLGSGRLGAMILGFEV